MRALIRLLPYLRPYRGAIILGLLIAVANNAIMAIGPWLLKLAVDSLQSTAKAHHLAKYAGLIVVVAIVAGILRFYLRKIMIGMSRHVELDLRNSLFAHLEKLPAAFYSRNRTGDLITRMTSDLESVRTVLGPGIMYPMDTVSTAVFVLIMMFILSLKLTLIVLISAPIVSLSVFYLGRITYRLHTRIQEQFSELSACAQENLAGVRVVRSFAQEEREIARYTDLNHEYVQRNFKMVRVQAAFFPTMFMLFELGTAAILLFGGWGIIRGQLSLGDFVAFVGYLGMLAWPMVSIGWVANLFQRGAASMQRLSQIMDTPPEIAAPENPVVPPEMRGEIVFEKVSFDYNDSAHALSEINWTIPAGKTVAIVGRTGSGKTSLISLIPRLFDPSAGRVLVDGIPTTDWDLETLRRNVGVVPQDALLFSDTIDANIRFGVESSNGTDFHRVAEISQIAKDVTEFSDGYQTRVGERGLSLSGGQKGRATLARALLRDPAILILDDALAAVDTHTEEQILSGLRDFMRGRTSIIISHRVSTVREADEIIVLDQGRIIERGTHAELIALGGYYAELDRMQRIEEELKEMD
ncbi:MAG: ABC transporter ATP-binding protein [Calditrichota bacterium]